LFFSENKNGPGLGWSRAVPPSCRARGFLRAALSAMPQQTQADFFALVL